MLGAIVGDIVGSVHEYSGTKTKAFPLFVPHSDFTDDSVLTVAVGEWVLDGGDLAAMLARYTRAFPGRGYGSRFNEWAAASSRAPYNSFGNGSAMRVSAVGFAADSIDDALDRAARSAAVTHNHSEGIRGAQATALASFSPATVRTRSPSGERSRRAAATICRAASTRFGRATDSPSSACRRCRRR